ncbi:D-alanyl-D-alanine carboxypeptidase [Candidatus Peregrinibacteria bacterium]|nr:D-alanyl-D-alanine carboxypeptidase [Candidatus Peregrinibacteria bacterium]
MISTFLSIFTAGTLMTNDVPNAVPHTMPWNENVLLEATAVPIKKEQNIAPVINAKAALVVDLKNGYILYEKNIHESLPIASLTKLMTTTIVLEENSLDEIATISDYTASTEGKKTWLASGEKITVENLLFAALIDSANDAAVALAEHNAGSVEAFVEKMNKKATDLGLLSTRFTNPTGLDEDNPGDDPEHPRGNYSSAYDLALLGRYAYGKSFVRRAVSKKELEVASTNEAIQHKLTNTNELLGSYLKVLGLKTGTTDLAGECLITVIQNDQGNDILTVVLNSPSRFNETKLLADWTFRTYTW